MNAAGGADARDDEKNRAREACDDDRVAEEEQPERPGAGTEERDERADQTRRRGADERARLLPRRGPRRSLPTHLPTRF